MLTRHFIQKNLFKYFTGKGVVIPASEPIPFTTLLNRWEYRSVLSEKCKGTVVFYCMIDGAYH